MKKNIKHYISIIASIFFIFFISLLQGVELKRNYSGQKYCHSHQESSIISEFIQKNISLIPTLNKECDHIECNKCHQVWIAYYEFYDDDIEENIEEEFLTCECKEKIFGKTLIGGLKVDRDYWMSTWTDCRSKCIYPGYLSDEHLRYSSFFCDYLEYIAQNPECECFWSEKSNQAAIINNKAYDLFKDLFANTDLKQLVKDLEKQNKFFLTTSKEFNLHGVVVQFVCHSFFYSDYDWICRDLEFYSNMHFGEKSAAKIKEKLNNIREVLALLFLDLYQSCLEKHPSNLIVQEIVAVKDFLGRITFDDFLSGFFGKALESNYNSLPCLLKDTNQFLYHKAISFPKSESANNDKKLEIPSRPNNWGQSDFLFSYGSFLSNQMLYKGAIQFLTQSIQLNPFNRDAYIERAKAYFELNQLTLALKDYQFAKKLTIESPLKSDNLTMAAVYIPEEKIEFANGLILGTIDGAADGLTELGPSIFGCCRGISNGLWAFVCSPIEISQELVTTAYAAGEFISNHSKSECLQLVIPEIKELALAWDKLNDHTRGKKIGYIIGKHGVDVFALAGAIKSSKIVTALSRANTMCTLESCATSEAKLFRILEESNRYATLRESLISESVKSGKILVQNYNKQIHIMQPKHGWDKVLKLTGDVKEDCKRVVQLLEEHKIYLEKFRKKTMEPPQYEFIRYDHEMQIHGFNVKAVFNKNPETGEAFLNDAWVVIK